MSLANLRYAGLLGAELRKLRDLRGYTLRRAAAGSGSTFGQVSKYERNVQVPSVGSLSALLDAYGYWLVGVPAHVAQTYDEREALIRAARNLAHCPEADERARLADLAEAAEALGAAEHRR